MVFGPELRHVVNDPRSRFGIDDDHHVVKPGGEGVGGNEVNDPFAVQANGSQLLQPAVTASAPGGQDDERRAVHHDHRTTEEAQVIPAPKPVMSAYSPGLMRPFWRASSLEVFP